MPGVPARKRPVREFVTYAPSLEELEPVLRTLREAKPAGGPVAVEIRSAPYWATRWWMVLALVPTFLVVVIIVRTIVAGFRR